MLTVFYITELKWSGSEETSSVLTKCWPMEFLCSGIVFEVTIVSLRSRLTHWQRRQQNFMQSSCKLSRSVTTSPHVYRTGYVSQDDACGHMIPAAWCWGWGAVVSIMEQRSFKESISRRHSFGSCCWPRTAVRESTPLQFFSAKKRSSLTLAEQKCLSSFFLEDSSL